MRQTDGKDRKDSAMWVICGTSQQQWRCKICMLNTGKDCNDIARKIDAGPKTNNTIEQQDNQTSSADDDLWISNL